MAVADEDSLIQRVPLAVPIVRILQLNPAHVLERHVPGVVAKIASFLKSKVFMINDTFLCLIESVGEGGFCFGKIWPSLIINKVKYRKF